MQKKLPQKCNNKDCHRKDSRIRWVGFWQEFKKCLASNRSWEGAGEGWERERGGLETKSCPLLSCSREERKGVVANSIISRYSVKRFVCTIRLRFLQRLLHLWSMRIADFGGIAKPKYILTKNFWALFHCLIETMGWFVFEKERWRGMKVQNLRKTWKQGQVIEATEVWFRGHHGYAWQLREGAGEVWRNECVMPELHRRGGRFPPQQQLWWGPAADPTSVSRAAHQHHHQLLCCCCCP